MITLNKDLLMEVKALEGVTLQAEEMVQVEEKITIHQAETQTEVMEIKQVPQGKMQAEKIIKIIPHLLENPAEIIEIKLGPPVEKVHLEMQINLQEKARKNKIKEVLSQNQTEEERNQEAIRKRVVQVEVQKNQAEEVKEKVNRAPQKNKVAVKVVAKVDQRKDPLKLVEKENHLHM